MGPRVSSGVELRAAPSTPDVSGGTRRRVRPAPLLAGFTGVMLAALASWPYVGGSVLVADDVPLLFAYLEPPMYFASWSAPVFRLPDMMSSFVLDPAGRGAQHTVWLHMPAAAAIAYALWVLVRDRTADPVPAFAGALAWWMASVGTTVVVWQPDTISQTWVAAAGVWLLMATWDGVAELRRGAVPVRRIVLLSALLVGGLLSKEIFFGWSAAAVVLVVGAALSLRRSGVPVVVRHWVALLAPVLVLPAAYLAARFAFGGLSSLGAYGDHYSPTLGLNAVLNVALAGLGMTAIGPTHVVPNPEAQLWVRLMPLLGCLVTLFVVVAPVALAEHGERARRLGGIAAVLGLSFLGYASVLLTDQVAEQYVMGPNIGVAMLVGLGCAAIARAWRARRSPTGSRAVAWAGAAVLSVALAIGLFGIGSRAYHFWVTWDHTARIDRAVMEGLASVRADTPRLTVIVPGAYAQGHQHGVYVMPPIRAYDPTFSAYYWNHSSGTPRLEFSVEGTPDDDGAEADPVDAGEQVILDVPLRPRADI